MVSSGALGAKAAGDFTPDHRAHHAIDVVDGQRGLDLFLALERRCGQFQQRHPVECIVQPVILADLAIAAHVVAHRRLPQQRRQVDPACLPVADSLAALQLINATYHVIHSAEAQLAITSRSSVAI